MADELEMELKGVNNTNAAYQGDNTDSYAKSIEDQYSKIAAQQAASVNDAVNQGTSALTYMQNKVAPQLAKENLAAAQADRAEAIERRDGVEVNNGNRQRIGHSQYDIADNTYDQAREDIFQQQRQLELDLTRQISDLRSKGEYAKADAALQNAQQKFKQLYADQMRADKNLRSNYEYGTKLKREDEAIAREDERLNTKWLRSLGESFLQRGVMPSDGMLEAMGLDKDTAQLYINAVLGMYGYGGGGGGGRGRSGGGSGGSGSDDGLVSMPVEMSYGIAEPEIPLTYVSNTGKQIAMDAISKARSGELTLPAAITQITNSVGTDIGGTAAEKYIKAAQQQYRTGQMLATDAGQRARASSGTSSSGSVVSKVSSATTAAAAAAAKKKQQQQQLAAQKRQTAAKTQSQSTRSSTKTSTKTVKSTTK